MVWDRFSSMATHHDTSDYGSALTPATADPMELLTLDELRERHSMKWTRYPADVLPLWVAEMDAVVAQPVIDAVMTVLTTGDTGYPGRDRLLQDAFVGFAWDRWGWQVPVSSVSVVPDVMHGIVEVLRASKAQRVAITSPVYPPFRAYPEQEGMDVVDVPLTDAGRLDIPALAAAFEHVDVMLLCNPHNPSGVAHTVEELTALLDAAHAHGVLIIADEIHGPLTSVRADTAAGGSVFTPVLTVPTEAAVVTVTSAAKGWHLAGFKAGVAVHNDAAAPLMANLASHVADGVGFVSMVAHAAAFREGRDWLSAAQRHIDEARDVFGEALADLIPDAHLAPADATYLAWVDFRDVRTASGATLGQDPSEFFLKHARVAMNPGPSFGPGGAGFARVNLATRKDILVAAVTQMSEALARG